MRRAGVLRSRHARALNVAENVVERVRENRAGPEAAPAFRTGDRAALGIWVLTRLALAVVVAWSLPPAALAGLAGHWFHWDAALFTEIARYGYAGEPGRYHGPPAGPSSLLAFFPGLPLALRAVHHVIPDWSAAALAVSLAAGAVAVVALSRLADLDGPPGSGPRAVLALALCPSAVFLFAGYSEALFLACALPAWLLARRGRWAAAALCAAGASAVRVTGLFLAVALVVEFLAGGEGLHARGGWRRAPWLAVPFAPVAAYMVFVWRRTGDPLAWLHAEANWPSRHFAWPWDAFATTFAKAADPHYAYVAATRLELLAMLTGIALTGWLLTRRRWAEATYVGLQLAALGTCAYYQAIGRAALLWWPLWLLIGGAGVRRPWRYAAFAAVSGALMVRFALIFTAGRWAG